MARWTEAIRSRDADRINSFVPVFKMVHELNITALQVNNDQMMELTHIPPTAIRPMLDEVVNYDIRSRDDTADGRPAGPYLQELSD